MYANQFYHEELLRLRAQKPFRPYTIETKDGHRYRILEFARMVSNGRDVLVIGPKDATSRFKVEDIRSIRQARPTKKRKQSGQR